MSFKFIKLEHAWLLLDKIMDCEKIGFQEKAFIRINNH